MPPSPGARRQALAPTAEYALEVEMIAIGDTVKVCNLPAYSFDAPSLQSGPTIFPKYPLGNLDEIPNLITLFHRDFWNSLGADVGVEKVTFSIQDWSG